MLSPFYGEKEGGVSTELPPPYTAPAFMQYLGTRQWTRPDLCRHHVLLQTFISLDKHLFLYPVILNKTSPLARTNPPYGL